MSKVKETLKNESVHYNIFIERQDQLRSSSVEDNSNAERNAVHQQDS